MQSFKALASVVMIYCCVQGAVWLGKGRAKDALIVFVCAPVLLIIYFIIKYVNKKRDEKIDRELKYSSDDSKKSSLFHD